MIGKKSGSIYLDEDVHNSIKQLAQEDKRSFNSYVNIVLRKHAEKNKKLKLVKRRVA